MILRVLLSEQLDGTVGMEPLGSTTEYDLGPTGRRERWIKGDS